MNLAQRLLKGGVLTAEELSPALYIVKRNTGDFWLSISWTSNW